MFITCTNILSYQRYHNKQNGQYFLTDKLSNGGGEGGPEQVPPYFGANVTDRASTEHARNLRQRARQQSTWRLRGHIYLCDNEIY